MAEILNADAQVALQSIVQRIERFEEERAEIADIIKDLFADGKARGFDRKIIRKCLAIRRMDPAKYREECDMVDLYMHALEAVAMDRAA